MMAILSWTATRRMRQPGIRQAWIWVITAANARLWWIDTPE
jgi:hypothetical protein